MLDLAASQSKSLVELQRLQGYTVASLLETRAYLASKYGIEVPAFANGGVFTNGVVSSPTLFNMGLMGEDGPEAVMPLTRIGGKLGVRTAGDSRSSSELVREIRMLRAEVRAVVTHTSKSAKILARVSQDGESLSVSFSPDGEPFPVVVQE
jgi:phage-related minor tail protein